MFLRLSGMSCKLFFQRKFEEQNEIKKIHELAVIQAGLLSHSCLQFLNKMMNRIIGFFLMWCFD